MRKHQKKRGCVTAARACAARLMAPGAALEIPRLSRGCLDAFCPAGDRKSFLLARTLLQTGIGDAQDWQDSQRNAVQFMARTIDLNHCCGVRSENGPSQPLQGAQRAVQTETRWQRESGEMQVRVGCLATLACCQDSKAEEKTCDRVGQNSETRRLVSILPARCWPDRCGRHEPRGYSRLRRRQAPLREWLSRMSQDRAG